jgi:hypothetical protein
MSSAVLSGVFIEKDEKCTCLDFVIHSTGIDFCIPSVEPRIISRAVIIELSGGEHCCTFIKRIESKRAARGPALYQLVQMTIRISNIPMDLADWLLTQNVEVYEDNHKSVEFWNLFVCVVRAIPKSLIVVPKRWYN